MLLLTTGCEVSSAVAAAVKLPRSTTLTNVAMSARYFIGRESLAPLSVPGPHSSRIHSVGHGIHAASPDFLQDPKRYRTWHADLAQRTEMEIS